MIDFEKQIMKAQLDGSEPTNADDFLAKLHNRVSESKDNRRTVVISFCLIIVVSLMTITQFGAPGVETDYFYDGEIETFFGTDFWTINSDSLDHDSSYTYDIAYFHARRICMGYC